MKTLLTITSLVIATSYIAPAISNAIDTAETIQNHNTKIEQSLAKRG